MFYVLELKDSSSIGTWGTIMIEGNFFEGFFILYWDLLHQRMQGHGRGCVSM